MSINRRQFVSNAALLAAGVTLAPNSFLNAAAKKNSLQISLAQWSLHKSFFAKKIDNLDFASIAKKQFGLSAIEFVNQFFKDKAKDTTYLNDLLKRSKDNGVVNHLIMIDGEGGLGEADTATRNKAVENHYKWVDAAKHLECKTIRVNAYGTSTREEVMKAAVDGLGRLAEYGEKAGINIIVENHGGFSSDGQWLAGVIKQVGKKNVGTLPDFGNFCLTRESNKCVEEYDRYKGTKEMMPYAKGVSAKAYDFDEAGNCIETDYVRMMKVVKDANFSGYIGIEYEGDKLTEVEGIKKTVELVKREGKKAGFIMK